MTSPGSAEDARRAAGDGARPIALSRAAGSVCGSGPMAVGDVSAGPPAAARDAPAGALRIVTYNVRGLKDDRDALVRVIRALRPDVLCVQEAPRLPGWRRARRTFAHAAGMSVAAGGRVGGTAVLTSPSVRLMSGRGHRLRWFAGLERRSVALAVLEKGRARYAVCSAHLDLRAGARLSHAAQIVPILEDFAREFAAAPVLAGDLNEPPGAAVWRLLTSRYTDCFSGRAGSTFPAREPRVRIDAIFAGPGLTVLSCGVPDVAHGDMVAASDHRPVVAEIAPLSSVPA